MTQNTAYMVAGAHTDGGPMTPLSADERAAILEAVRDFAQTEIAPHALEWDEQKHFPRETLRPRRRAGPRRHLRARGRRRLGSHALRRRRDRRGAREGRPVDRRLHHDPQHGRVDDRLVRHRGAAPHVAAAPDRDDATSAATASPSRVRGRMPRPSPRARSARRRRLRADRRQAVHLGRRRGVRLRRHGAHRRAGRPRASPRSSFRRTPRACRSARTRRRWAGTRSPRVR